MTAILFEVYPKAALHEPFAQLVLLDRDKRKDKAIKSARRWGALVIRVECRILTKNPLTREVINSEIIFVHKRRHSKGDARDKITRRQLMGKLRQNSKSVYRGYRR